MHGPINKILQTRDLDIFAATTIIKNTIPTLKNMREENSLDKVCIQVKNYIDDIEYEIEPMNTTRIKKVPRKSGELSTDESVSEPIKKIRIQTYNTIFDVTLTEINNLFNDTSCSVLKDLSLLTERRILEVRKNKMLLPKDAFLGFCQVYSKFVDYDALISEYLQFVVN